MNPQPHPDAVYLWIMRAFATDAKFVCTYRYRQPLSGAELYHHGIVGPDGVTPTRGGAEFSRAAGDLVQLRSAARCNATPPDTYTARRAAILYSREVRWDLDNHKQHKAWDSYEHLLKYHRALKRVGAPVEVITRGLFPRRRRNRKPARRLPRRLARRPVDRNELHRGIPPRAGPRRR